jgi:hypothetical protein
LDAGWLRNLVSLDEETQSCKHVETGSVIMELNTFPAQRIHKQQKKDPSRGDFYTVRGMLKKEARRDQVARDESRKKYVGLSQSYITTDGQSASPSWIKALVWGIDQIFITVRQLRIC